MKTFITVFLAFVLPWTVRLTPVHGLERTLMHSETGLVAYPLVAAAAVAFVWWGVRTQAKALVNLGMVLFAMTVAWFYFSNVMADRKSVV